MSHPGGSRGTIGRARPPKSGAPTIQPTTEEKESMRGGEEKRILAGSGAVLGIALGVAALILAGGFSPAARSDENPKGKPNGVPVAVTDEMRGAGIVSSGVALPPIP